MFTQPSTRSLIVLAKNEAIANHIRGLQDAVGRDMIVAASTSFDHLLATRRFEAAILCLDEGDCGAIESAKRLAPNIPAVVISGADRALPAVQAMRSGAAMYLPHPVTAETLRETLQHLSNGGEGAVELSLAVAERKAIERALSASRGNVKRAAETLGIARATLYRKMARFGLRQPSASTDAPS